MKFFATAAASALAISGAVAQYTTSKPFKLQLVDSSAKYNGKVLEAVHEGAGIEGLAPYNDSSSASTYKLKTFSSTQKPTKLGQTGTLIYSIVVNGGSSTEKEALTLYQDPSTNVALGLFEPGTTSNVQVAFDSNDLMNQQTFLIDTVTPPTETKEKAYYRWFICETNYEGYTYETLTWVYGIAKPQNPSCVSTNVKRVFV